MKSRERVGLALEHQEADRVPFDLGGTGLSTIHVTAYMNLRRYLALPEVQPEVAFVPEQLVRVDEDLAERLEADVRPVLPGRASGFDYAFVDEGQYEAYRDEWGIGWRLPKDGGFYYDMYYHPLADADSMDELASVLRAHAYEPCIILVASPAVRKGRSHGPKSCKTTAPTQGSACSIREMANSPSYPTLGVARACSDPSRGGSRR